MWIKFKFLFSKIWDFIAPTVQVLSSAVVQEFLPIALDAVRATAQYASDNDEEKRRKAFNAIEMAVKSKGRELPTSIINLLIEMALQKIKAS